jgi:hypothetical protein
MTRILPTADRRPPNRLIEADHAPRASRKETNQGKLGLGRIYCVDDSKENLTCRLH